MLKGIFLLDEYAYNRIYGPEERQQIQELVDLVQPVQTRQTIAQDPAVLQDVEVIFSGWGCPQFTEEFLNQAPKLKAVF